MSRRKSRSEYFPALTGLRFVLALWVIAHHLTSPGMMLEPFAQALPAPARELVEGGYLAVQMFFLLSGFVLALTYGSTRWDRSALTRYAAARFARIYPAYLVSVAVVSYFIAQALIKPSPGWSAKITALFDYAFILQGWRRSDPGWNTPAWSLSCELFFYLCFPAIFPFIRRAGGRMAAAVVIVSFSAPVLFTRMGVPSHWKPVHHFADFTMGIAAGGIYGILRSRGVASKRSAWLYLPAIAAGGALVAWPRILSGTRLDLNTALRPLDAIALIGFALGGGAIAKLLSLKSVGYLGQASYSMYILHVPLLWWYGNGGLRRLHLPPAPAAVIYTIAVLACAALCFEFVEKPAGRWIRTWTARRLEPGAQLRAAA